MDGAGGSDSAALRHNPTNHPDHTPGRCPDHIPGLLQDNSSVDVPTDSPIPSRLVPPGNCLLYSSFVLSTKWLPKILSSLHHISHGKQTGTFSHAGPQPAAGETVPHLAYNRWVGIQSLLWVSFSSHTQVQIDTHDLARAE